MKNDVSELIIYKQYLELIYYTEMICEKYPKREKLAIVSTIKNTTYDDMKEIISAYKFYDKDNKLDINLKMLKVLIRVSYKRKYITLKNYEAWSKKLHNIGSLLGGWINSCVRQ